MERNFPTRCEGYAADPTIQHLQSCEVCLPSEDRQPDSPNPFDKGQGGRFGHALFYRWKYRDARNRVIPKEDETD